MHKYASSSPESRELVSELEFVWDQVKSNVPSSSSSSPVQTLGMPLDISRHGEPPKYRSRSKEREQQRESKISDSQIRLMSPVSRDQLAAEAEAEEQEEEEFVDAPDSQFDEGPSPPRNIDAILSSPGGSPPGEEKRPKVRRKSTAIPSADEKWKKSISASIIKLTAELAAVREQLESRRLFAHTLQFRIARFVTKAIWGIVKHIALDILFLGIVLLWLRSKKDRRFEGAIRVLLGDAVAQVQRVGEKQLGKIQLPKLGGSKRPN